MKRFLLFAHATYYPSGGWHDLEGSYNTIEEAMSHKDNPDWPDEYFEYHIVDSLTWKIVKEKP